MKGTLLLLSLLIIVFFTPSKINAQCDNTDVTTFAGMTGIPGSMDGVGTAASFSGPEDVAADGAGNIYVADRYNHLIRKISPTGEVSIFAGTGAIGNTNGTGTAASFSGPRAVATDAAGNVYVADYGNQLIRKITPAGVVTTFAGSGAGGGMNGTGIAASFSRPIAVATDVVGNVYVVEFQGDRIRKITPTGEVTTLAGGSRGNTNGPGAIASFYFPSGIVIDAAGNAYVADRLNNLIRKITPAGEVSTFAGSGTGSSIDGVGIAASFSVPSGITIDAAGNLYVTEFSSHLIRKITPTGVVTTIAGTGTAGSTNDTGTAASFSIPLGLTMDAAGNLYVADSGNHLIRKIGNCTVPTGPPIPAMSQWGIFIFCLLIMNLSVFFLLRRELI